MPVQVFLQGKLTGTEEFLLAPAESAHPDHVFAGRSHWISLLGEILPRTLLAELGLAKILLGSSGGGQFLVLLPEEFLQRGEDFLAAAAREITSLSNNLVRLIWTSTENLGDWSDIRKRLNDGIVRLAGAPAPAGLEAMMEGSQDATDYFAGLGLKLRDAESVGWSPEYPGRVLIGEGKHRWNVAGAADAVPFARNAAPSDDNSGVASTAELARRAAGVESWGVLRGDVDGFEMRLRRSQTIEEYIQLSVLYKQFVAGELEALCSMPEFWRKITVIYSGGDDFALYGAWDALIGLAREMERLFHQFAEQNLREFAGLEGKTITMALALAPAQDVSVAAVFEEAGRRLEAAKSSGKDCIWLFGRILEWKEFSEAAGLKDRLLRMITEFGCSPQYLRDLCGIYRETQSRLSRRQMRRSGKERPWRYHRRIVRTLTAARTEGGSSRGEYQKARVELIGDLIGRSALTVKLRPAGRVALEWARLATEELQEA